MKWPNFIFIDCATRKSWWRKGFLSLIGYNHWAHARRKPMRMKYVRSNSKITFFEVSLGHGTRDPNVEPKGMNQREGRRMPALDEGCSVNGKGSSNPKAGMYVGPRSTTAT